MRKGLGQEARLVSWPLIWLCFEVQGGRKELESKPDLPGLQLAPHHSPILAGLASWSNIENSRMGFTFKSQTLPSLTV